MGALAADVPFMEMKDFLARNSWFCLELKWPLFAFKFFSTTKPRCLAATFKIENIISVMMGQVGALVSRSDASNASRVKGKRLRGFLMKKLFSTIARTNAKT